MKYIDPDGRESSDEIMGKISKLQNEMDPENVLPEQFNKLLDLGAAYNQAVIKEGNLTIDDYMKNGTITCGFGDKQNAVGNYQVNYHTGIDCVGGDLISPFFMVAKGSEQNKSNGIIFSVIGTDLSMRVKHGDAGSLEMSGDFFRPGNKVMPFPINNNFNLASTGPHFHIEMSNGSNFVDPLSLKSSTLDFKITTNGGNTWKKLGPNF